MDDMRPSRLFGRDTASYQSRGKMNIRKIHTNRYLTVGKDWSHSILEMKTWKLLLFFSATYTFFYVAFMPFYYYSSDRCGLEITSWLDSLYLSLETMVLEIELC